MEMLFGGITMRPDPVFPLGTDSMLLADFVRLPKNAQVCDLGAGSGALGLLLCGADPTCRVTGVELRRDACALAQLNVADNRLEGRLRVVQGDLCSVQTLLPANGFSVAVSNPPYFAPSSGPVSAKAPAARAESGCTPAQWCAAAAWLLTFGGTFSLAYRPARLCDLFSCLRAAGLEPKRLRFVRHRPEKDASLFLVEAKLGAGAGLRVEPELILANADGTPSAAYLKIYHQEGAV